MKDENIDVLHSVVLLDYVLDFINHELIAVVSEKGVAATFEQESELTISTDDIPSIVAR